MLLFIVPRLPHTLHNPVYHLINIPAFNPYVLGARFIVSCRHRLLNYHGSRRDHNRSRRYNRRLRDDNRLWPGSFVYRGSDDSRTKYSGSDTQSPAPLMVVMVVMMMTATSMVMARRGWRGIPSATSASGTTGGRRNAHYQRAYHC